LNKFNAARRTVASLSVVGSKVLVYLKLVAQWTQVLSSKNWFTMSLVVVACNELVSCLKNLSDDATKLVSSELLDEQFTGKYVPNLLGTCVPNLFGTNYRLITALFFVLRKCRMCSYRLYDLLGSNLRLCVDSLLREYHKYLGDDYLKTGPALVAAYLDPTVIDLLTEDQLNFAETRLRHTLSKSPTIVATGAASRGQPVTSFGVFGAASHRHLLKERAATSAMTSSELDKEIDEYHSVCIAMKKSILIAGMKSRETVGEGVEKKTVTAELEGACQALQPEYFWPDHAGRLPALAMLAARNLSAAACSSEVERLFSVSGQITTQKRSSLSSNTVKMLSSLHVWLRDDQTYDSYRRISRARSCVGFARRGFDAALCKAVSESATGGEEALSIEEEEEVAIDSSNAELQLSSFFSDDSDVADVLASMSKNMPPGHAGRSSDDLIDADDELDEIDDEHSPYLETTVEEPWYCG